MNQEPTIQDVLDAVNTSSSRTEERFRGLEKNLKSEISSVKTEISSVKTELTQTINKQKLELIDAMDDKMADLKGHLVILMRKEDKKVTTLINLMRDKQLLNDEEANMILALDPFPQP
ncbi:MAG: hypothetical protein ABIH21_05090 [Patescibacteria group bacterium]